MSTINELNKELRQAGIESCDMEIVAENTYPAVRINGEPFHADLADSALTEVRDCQVATFAFIAGWKLALRNVRDLIAELAEGADEDFLEEILENTGISKEIRDEIGL